MNEWIQHKVLGTVKKVTGVTISLVSKDVLSIKTLVLERVKGKLVIVDKYEGISSYKELKEVVPKSCPVAVNIEGVGVLVKKVEFNSDGSPKGQIVNDPDQFVIQPYQGKEGGFVSIVRKDLFDSIVQNLEEQKIPIVSVACNPFVVENIFPIINLEGEHQFGNWLINAKNNEIIDVKPSSAEQVDNYKIGDDNVQSYYTLSYADCLAFFTEDYNISGSNHYLLSEFTFSKLIQYVGWFVLGALLFILAVNFLVNDYYTKEYELVSVEYNNNKSLLEKLNLAETDLKKKENLIIQGRLSGKSDYSWYADRMASILPKELVLTKLKINPLIKRIQANKEIKFENAFIEVQGESRETRYIHNWIELLKKEEWVSEVEMTYYGRKELGKNGEFHLKLIFNVE